MNVKEFRIAFSQAVAEDDYPLFDASIADISDVGLTHLTNVAETAAEPLFDAITALEVENAALKARAERLNARAADLYAALELVERHRKPGAETVELSSGEWQAIRVALNNSGEVGWKAFPALLASLGEARTRVAELEEILRNVWNQFAVQKPDGSRWAGGLSTLENVDAALRGGDQTGEKL